MNICTFCGSALGGGKTICASCERLLLPPVQSWSTHAPSFAIEPPKPPEPREPELVAQTVMGQRLWRWHPGDGLHGMVQKWESGFMQAACEQGQHKSPHWTEPQPESDDMLARSFASIYGGLDRCLCGVNAWKLTHLFDGTDLKWAQGVEYGSMLSVDYVEAIPVLGILELGGEVHEYERGYRAQYGLIVEGTVLTSLPVDKSALEELEETYDAPFRVRSHDDWKEEWEATYGRDREAGTSDQSAEAGTSTGTFSFSPTRTQGTITGASAHSQHTHLTRAWQKQWDNMFLTPLPKSRWTRFKDWLRRNWPSHLTTSWMYATGAAVYFALGLPWSSLLFVACSGLFLGLGWRRK